MARRKVVNYLNNKDILKEIHKSKSSYSYYIDKEYDIFDAIVNDLSEINDEVILAAKEKRIKRIIENDKDRQYNEGIAKKNIVPLSISVDDIPTSDLVFRVMTYDHIPLQEGRVKTPKKEADYHVRLFFKPFKHYIINNDNFVEVGRSHWKNGLHNGEFCQDHGRITDKLGMMYMELANRFARKGNYRNYCVDSETEALTQRGWLGINQITVDDIILSCDPSDSTLKWSKIKDIYRNDEYSGNMFKMTSVGFDALVTPGHKWLTTNGIKVVDHLIEKDKLLLMGKQVDGNTNKKYDDHFVELVGWIITDGHMSKNKNKFGVNNDVLITQSEGEKSDSIRNILESNNYSYSECKMKNYPYNDIIKFRIKNKWRNLFSEIIPNKKLTMKFILDLTSDQRKILLNTMISGDGYKRHNGLHSYTQKDVKDVEIFQALLVMCGYRSNVHEYDCISFGKKTRCCTTHIFSERRNITVIENVDMHGSKVTNRNNIGQSKINYPNIANIEYTGTVWCPSTEYGTFVARRNGTVYVTGNSYKEDMVDRAIEQLVAAGLSFDESKTDNPFAYFTVCCTTSFTSILNEEKKNQNLRDNLIEAHGGSPSFTRQVENEFNQRMEAYYEEKGLQPPKPLNVPKVGFKRKAATNKE